MYYQVTSLCISNQNANLLGLCICSRTAIRWGVRRWKPIFKNNWFMFELTQKEFGYYYCVTTITMLRTLARKALLPVGHRVRSFLCIRTIIKHRTHPVTERNCLAPQEECGGEEKTVVTLQLEKKLELMYINAEESG